MATTANLRTLDAQRRHIMQRCTTAQLCDLFETTETYDTRRDDWIEIAAVRGWIMDELEARNPERFAEWIDTSYEASPRSFFC